MAFLHCAVCGALLGMDDFDGICAECEYFACEDPGAEGERCGDCTGCLRDRIEQLESALAAEVEKREEAERAEKYARELVSAQREVINRLHTRLSREIGADAAVDVSLGDD